MTNSAYKRLQQKLTEDSSFIVLCIMAALAFAGALYILLAANHLVYWDEKHYLELAENLHRGIYSYNGVSSTAFEPPGYPFLLYLFLWISSSVFFLKLMNFIFFSSSIWLVYLLLCRITSPFTGLIGALLAALYPLFFYAAGTLYPQMAASLVLLVFLRIISTRSSLDTLSDFTAGLLVGFLLLISPSFLLFMPFFLLFPIVFKRKDKLKAGTLFLVGSLLVVSIWTVRNYAVFDRFLLISSNGGVNLLIGNSEHAAPNLGVNTNIERYIAASENLNEFERDAYFRQEAFKWIFHHPAAAFKLYILKWLNYFNFANDLAVKSQESDFYDFLSFVSYYPLLLLAVLRVCFRRKYPLSPLEKFVLIIWAASPFLEAIFFTRLRFRIPFDFLMILLAAAFLGNLLADKTEVTGHTS